MVGKKKYIKRIKISRLSYKNISKCLQVILNSSQGIVNSITNLSTDNEWFAFKQRFSIIYSNRLTSFCIMKSQARLQISRFFNCIREFFPLVVSKKNRVHTYRIVFESFSPVHTYALQFTRIGLE